MTGNERFCSSCAHVVGRRTYLDTAESWKCHAPENVISTSQDLVTGSTVYHLRFEDCYTTRSSAEDSGGCGSIGRWYKLYEPFQPKVVGGRGLTADTLLKELESLPEIK